MEQIFLNVLKKKTKLYESYLKTGRKSSLFKSSFRTFFYLSDMPNNLNHLFFYLINLKLFASSIFEECLSYLYLLLNLSTL